MQLCEGSTSPKKRHGTTRKGRIAAALMLAVTLTAGVLGSTGSPASAASTICTPSPSIGTCVGSWPTYVEDCGAWKTVPGYKLNYRACTRTVGLTWDTAHMRTGVIVHNFGTTTVTGLGVSWTACDLTPVGVQLHCGSLRGTRPSSTVQAAGTQRFYSLHDIVGACDEPAYCQSAWGSQGRIMTVGGTSVASKTTWAFSPLQMLSYCLKTSHPSWPSYCPPGVPTHP